MKTTDTDALRQAVLELENELADLLLEQSDMLLKQKPWLEQEYMKKIGSLEYGLYLMTSRAQRMYRLRDFIQADINLKGCYDLAQINNKLDLEFSSFLANIRARAEAVRSSLFNKWTLETRGDEVIKLIKKLYYELMKKLHPDLNPDLSANDQAAFLSIEQAYQSNDLDALQAWQILYKDRRDVALGADQLLDRYQALTSRIDLTKSQIADVTKTFPFNIQALLDDEPQIEERREQLQVEIDAVSSRYIQYANEVLNMLSHDDLLDLDGSWYDDDISRGIIDKKA